MSTLQTSKNVPEGKKRLKEDSRTWESVLQHVEVNLNCSFSVRTIMGIIGATPLDFVNVIVSIIRRSSGARQLHTQGIDCMLL